jgi:hypothetical protein
MKAWRTARGESSEIEKMALLIVLATTARCRHGRPTERSVCAGVAEGFGSDWNEVVWRPAPGSPMEMTRQSTAADAISSQDRPARRRQNRSRCCPQCVRGSRLRSAMPLRGTTACCRVGALKTSIGPRTGSLVSITEVTGRVF